MYNNSRKYINGVKKMINDSENKKPKKKKESELFEKSKKKSLTKKQMDKIKEHSKLHKGGMSSKHIKNMKKFMMEGDSFTKAHNKAKKLDK